MYSKTCQHCGAPFEAFHPRRQHCDSECFRAAATISAKRRYEGWTPERRLASSKVRLAIAAGRLVRQPCEQCGHEPADAHHDDYSKPLDVRWLCKRHHKLFHLSQSAA